jgi:hypothetical protein
VRGDLVKIVSLLFIFSLTCFAQDPSADELMGAIDLENDSEQFDETKYLDPLEAVDLSQNVESFEEVDPDLFANDYPEIEFTVIDKLRETEVENEKVLEKLLHRESMRSYSYAEKEALKIKLKDIVTSGKFMGVIRRGTKLIHLRTGKIYYNQKLLTVRAYRKSDYEGYKLLINKNGFSTYKVLSSKLNNIKEVTNLYKEPHYFKPVENKVDYNLINQKLKLQAQFNFHAGLTQSDFLQQISRVESGIGQTVRYEGEVYGNFNFPVKIGLSTSYENTFANFSNGGRYKMNSLSLGPVIKTPKFQMGQGTYSSFLQVRHAIFSKAVVESEVFSGDFSIAQTSVAIGLEKHFKTFLGDMIFGGNYQRQWLKPSSQNLAANIESESNTTDSFVLTLGYIRDVL